MLLNWETYKGLSAELRREYDFRFKDKKNSSSQGILGLLVFLLLMISLLMFVMYLVVTEPAFEGVIVSVASMLELMFRLVYVTTWMIVGFMLISSIDMTVHYVQYYKWKKNNNIKQTFWWSKWLK